MEEAEQVCSVGVSTTGLWQMYIIPYAAMYGRVHYIGQCMGEYINWAMHGRMYIQMSIHAHELHNSIQVSTYRRMYIRMYSTVQKMVISFTFFQLTVICQPLLVVFSLCNH